MGGGSGRRTAEGRLDHGGAWRSQAEWPAPGETERMTRLFAAYAEVRRGVAPAWDILAAR